MGEEALGGFFFAGSFMFLALSNWISQAIMLSLRLLMSWKLGWLSCAARSVLTERKVAHYWREQNRPRNTVSHWVSGVICPHFYFWSIMRAKVRFEGSLLEGSADLWRLPCWWHYGMSGSPRCLATCSSQLQFRFSHSSELSNGLSEPEDTDVNSSHQLQTKAITNRKQVSSSWRADYSYLPSDSN